MEAHATSLGATAHRRARACRKPRLTGLEVCVIGLAVLALALCAYAGAAHRATPVVGETVTVRISKADTLWEIAQDHPVQGLSTQETVRLIRALNNMESSIIVAGETLQVPALHADSTAMASR